MNAGCVLVAWARKFEVVPGLIRNSPWLIGRYLSCVVARRELFFRACALYIPGCRILLFMLLLQANIVSCKGYAWLRTDKNEWRWARSAVRGWDFSRAYGVHAIFQCTLKKMVNRAGGDSLASSGGETFVDRHTAVNMSVCDVTV